MAIVDITAFGASTASADNSAAIQKALDSAQAGDTVLIPQGTFMLNALVGIKPKSGTTLQIDGTLQVSANDQAVYKTVLVEGQSDVTIILNGALVGDRDTHQGEPAKQGGWGHGIVFISSTNCGVKGSGTVSKCWGDGVYVDKACKGISVSGITSTGNRRQGMSAIDVDGLTVSGCTFSNTGQGANGTPPGAGVDLEPDDPTRQSIRNVRFSGCKFSGNAGAGLLICIPPAARSNINADTSNSFDGQPIDGTDGVVPFYAKWLHSLLGVYWLYPKSVSL